MNRRVPGAEPYRPPPPGGNSFSSASGGVSAGRGAPRPSILGLTRFAVPASAAVLALASIGTVWGVHASVRSAADRLDHPGTVAAIAIADHAQAPYCTPEFTAVLTRVLSSCGLLGGENRRGCKPADVKTFASIPDADFNALFAPLKDRGGVIMFDEGSETLDPQAKKMIEERWQDRRGGRYFFIVARASKTGNADKNRALSHKRANSVMFDIKEQFQDSELEKEVGLLWLGNEFAQLDRKYCDWPNSRGDKSCNAEAINRSAFVSWVDCRL